MSKELKTGIVALFIIALGIWGFNFLKGKDVFSGSAREFTVEYPNVGGLTQASIVTINGLKVGKVEQISFNKNAQKKGSLIVSFSVVSDFKFSKESIVKIYTPSPLGGANLAIVPSFEGDDAKSGDVLTGVIEADIMSSLKKTLVPVQSKIESVLMNADSLIVGLNTVLDKKAQKSLNKSVSSLDNTVLSINKMLASVNSLMNSSKASIDVSLKNTAQITTNLSGVTNDLAKVNIANTVNKLENTLVSVNSLLDNIKNGKGSLGKLMTDDQMYNNLNGASKEMAELLREMKLNPKRFVHFSLFGKKAKAYNSENNKNNESNR